MAAEESVSENLFISIIRKNIAYFAGFAVYAIFGLILNLTYSQQQLFFYVNKRNTDIYDATMPFVTFVGDGIIYISVVLVLFFIKIRYGLVALVAWLLESAVVQGLKHFIFTNSPRPWKQFSNEHEIYLIKDFTPYMDNSFPSGHTASAFCLFTLLALFVANKKYGLFFLLMALLVAYSRIYLSQHNFIDTYVGAWIGILSALVIYFYFYGANRKFNQKATVMDRSLLKYRK